MSNPFINLDPEINNNTKLREPQREAYRSLRNHFDTPGSSNEVGIILPVGCGKSGCITLAPFACRSRRTLVIAPGLKIATQLLKDFNISNPSMFYKKCDIEGMPPYPEPVDIRGKSTNLADLQEADVVITNIQQLQGNENQWLDGLGEDFFDLILFDEGHHSVATTYQNLKQHFPDAKVVNFSATPLRADGQIMSGEVVYTYPVAKAIENGFVKHLRAKVLNPRTLKYVRRGENGEQEVTLDEVRRLGEEDADFRRSIVTSQETLDTIVDASINELEELRRITGENRLKIIASALNYEHCIQVTEAYESRGYRVNFVHSREGSVANQRIMSDLDNHELDVIVQVRKLGEGFDHPYLSVAAVFSVFSNLSPFVQFAGRIMRVIEQNAPGHPLNQGTVIFHAGSNVAQRWSDFQEFSDADRGYFEQLLPLESVDLTDDGPASTLRDPTPRSPNTLSISEQNDVSLEEIPLIDNEEALKAIQTLAEHGYTPEEVLEAMKHQEIPVSRVARRRAARKALDQRVQLRTGSLLKQHNKSPKGKDLDPQNAGRENFIVIKSMIDVKINERIGCKKGERDQLSKSQLDAANSELEDIISEIEGEIFNA
jgi:superfamily II DNA or RNA helicase